MRQSRCIRATTRRQTPKSPGRGCEPVQEKPKCQGLTDPTAPSGERWRASLWQVCRWVVYPARWRCCPASGRGLRAGAGAAAALSRRLRTELDRGCNEGPDYRLSQWCRLPVLYTGAVCRHRRRRPRIDVRSRFYRRRTSRRQPANRQPRFRIGSPSAVLQAGSVSIGHGCEPGRWLDFRRPLSIPTGCSRREAGSVGP